MDTTSLSALTALAAVIISPIISVYVVNRQFRATVVSANRQNWINQLRNEVAHFVRECVSLPSAYSADAVTREQAIERHLGITLNEITIRLMLNPKESLHTELLTSLKETSELTLHAINVKKGLAKDLNAKAEIVVTLTQKILKSEWVRVKAGR
jgi:hypothetical protein